MLRPWSSARPARTDTSAFSDAVVPITASLLVPVLVVVVLELPAGAIDKIASPVLGHLRSVARIPLPPADAQGSNSLRGRPAVAGPPGSVLPASRPPLRLDAEEQQDGGPVSAGEGEPGPTSGADAPGAGGLPSSQGTPPGAPRPEPQPPAAPGGTREDRPGPTPPVGPGDAPPFSPGSAGGGDDAPQPPVGGAAPGVDAGDGLTPVGDDGGTGGSGDEEAAAEEQGTQPGSGSGPGATGSDDEGQPGGGDQGGNDNPTESDDQPSGTDDDAHEGADDELDDEGDEPNDDEADGPGNSDSAPGHDPEGPGNSGDAPGQDPEGPGNSGDAPGQDPEGPGNSGDAPGHAPEGPGNSGDAPGQAGGGNDYDKNDKKDK
jgi:hypothetical protein